MSKKVPVNDIDYKRVFDASPCLFLILKPDEDFTITEATDAYLQATYTKRHEILNKGLFVVFPDNPGNVDADGTRNLRKSLEEVVAKKKPHVMAIQHYDIPVPADKGGGFEVRYWNPKNTPVFNEQNEIIWIIHQVEDVTVKVLLQQEIEKKSLFIKENQNRINLILNALLKYTAMDFSEKLIISPKGDELDAIACGLNALIDELETQVQLLTDANMELEYANKELDSFSYSVSHDLRAPLRAINGYSQVLIEDYGTKIDEVGKHVIGVIVKNAHKMGALIDDLLTFSRIGKQNLTKVPIHMNAMLDNAMQEFIGSIDKKIEFKIKSLQNCEGDTGMIKQVLTNLISNAVKYSGKKDKPVIDIGSYEENTHVIYYIKDNGAGFDMKYYDKLFGVFQRLHSASEFEGTGLGLALIQRIVKKHQGEVWAEAKLNEGATFYFSLPISKQL